MLDDQADERIDGQTQLTLVRNPDYNPSSDSTAARENLPDRFVWTVDSNADDILKQVAGGRARGRGVEHPAAGLRRYVDRPATCGRTCTRTRATAPGT